MKDKIGVIDSGLGGLTIAKEIITCLPGEDILYFGDTGRCPYGNRKKEEIKEYVWQMIHYLEHYPLKALVIACNTATSIMMEEIKEAMDIPVFGVIKPAAKEAYLQSKNKKIGVIGTTRTIESHMYERTLKELGEVEVYSLDCPLFVPFIEKGVVSGKEIEKVVYETLKPLRNTDIDTLVLGCTHYPLIDKVIKKAFKQDIRMVHSGEKIAKEIKKLIPLSQGTAGEHLYFVSGEEKMFKTTAEHWMEEKVNVKKIVFEKESV